MESLSEANCCATERVRSRDPSLMMMISNLGQVWLSADLIVSAIQGSALYAGIKMDTKDFIGMRTIWCRQIWGDSFPRDLIPLVHKTNGRSQCGTPGFGQCLPQKLQLLYRHILRASHHLCLRVRRF